MTKEIEMRDHVSEICDMYSYPVDAKETLLLAYDKIVEGKKDEFFALINTYEENICCDYQKLIDECKKISNSLDVHEYTVGLLLFVCLSKHLKEVYKEKGIPEQLWVDSVADLKWKLLECKAVKGIWGSFVYDWDWFPGFFNLKRFTFGRLQYEIGNFYDDEYEKDGIKLTRQTKVLYVHIPRTLTPLDEESCIKSYKMAKEFHKDLLINGKLPIACESWLLYKENEKLFPKGTNTRKFFDQFDITKSEDYGDDNPDIWRLFDMDYTPDLDKLPYDTTLRRAYVDHMKKGGKTGYGYGIFFF